MAVRRKPVASKTKKSSLWGKPSYHLAYSFVELLTLVLALETHSQEMLQALGSCLSTINLSKTITCAACAPNQQELEVFRKGPEPGACIWERAPTCTQCREHKLKSACKRIIILKKEETKQQCGPTHRKPLENLWLL